MTTDKSILVTTQEVSNRNVVHYDSTYITDGDSEIKPGATLSKQLDSYKDFDTVEVYLTGRRGGF